MTNKKTIPIWEKYKFISSAEDEEFIEIIRRNPIVYACFTKYNIGELTLMGALVSSIKLLVIQNESMFKSLVEMHMKESR